MKGLKIKILFQPKNAHMKHFIYSNEEANTRKILHGKDGDISPISHELWFVAGTVKAPRKIPAHAIELRQTQRLALPALHHAISHSGWDSTSHLCGFSKKSHRKVFVDNSELLQGLSDGNFEEAAKFIVK